MVSMDRAWVAMGAWRHMSALDPRPILSAVDVIAVIGEFVKLRRLGASWWGSCPFHKEKTQSFHVRPGTGRYKCFGCGESGDAIDFTRRIQGLSFREACEWLVPGSTGGEVVRYDDPMDDPVLRDLAYGKTQRAHQEYVENWPWSVLPRDGEENALPGRASVRTARGMGPEAARAWKSSGDAVMARILGKKNSTALAR